MILNPNANQLIPNIRSVSYETINVTTNNIVSEYDKAVVSLDITPYKDGTMLLINLSGLISFDDSTERGNQNKFNTWFIYDQSKKGGSYNYNSARQEILLYDEGANDDATVKWYHANTAILTVREDLYEFLYDTYLCIEFFYPVKFINATGIVIALP